MRKVISTVIGMGLLICLPVACRFAGSQQTGDKFAVQQTGGKFTVAANNIKLTVGRDGTVQTIGTDGKASAVLPGMVSLYDGKANDQAIALGSAASAGVEKGKLTLVYQDKRGALNVTQEFTASANSIFCKIIVRNIGKDQAWLRVSVNLPLFFQGETINRWDGTSVKKAFSGESSSDALYGAFPVAAVYDEKSGLAAGLAAEEIFSSIENSVSYGDKKTLSYGVKMVIDPGKEESVRFVVYGFQPDYGYLNAINAYYHEFPQMFRPTDGVDKDAIFSAHAASIRDIERGSTTRVSYEIPRRTYGRITWWYASYKKSGDWWGTDGEWDVVLAKQSKLEEAYKAPRSVYQADLKKQFLRADSKGVAPMFYILDWCEEELANRKYKSDILRFNDGNIVRVPGWVLGWADDYCMWWGGKFGEDTKKELAAIVKECAIYGFAVDCAEGDKNRPARTANNIASAPGKAYDDAGVYCDEGVAISKMMEYIHTLKKGDRVMAVFPNFSFVSPYFTTFRIDCALCEPDFQTVLREIDTHQRIRYLMGSKPRQLLGSITRENLGKSLDWKNMSPEQIRQMYKNLWDTALLMCLKLGYYPATDMQQGYITMAKNMPVVDTVIKAGWEPVPAIRLDADLWTARYGNDLQSYLFVGNQKTTVKDVQATIDNKYLGKGNYLFAAYDGSELQNAVQDGQTKLAFNLASKRYLMLKALLRVEGASNLKARISESGDLSGGSISAAITEAASQNAVISARIPEDGTAVAVKVNGQPVKFANEKGSVTFTANMAAGTKAQVNWKSKMFLSSAAKIKDFPFVSAANEPNCAIVVRDDADEWDISAANLLSEYFRFYFDTVKGKKVQILVKKASEVSGSNGNMVQIGLSGASKSDTVEVAGNNFVINGQNSAERHKLMFRLMRLLDQKYEYYGTIAGLAKDDDTRLMREKARLSPGAVLE